MRFDPAPGWREGMESGTEGRDKKVCNFFGSLEKVRGIN
jgi:hypothetical protein